MDGIKNVIYVVEGRKSDGVWKTISYHWNRKSADVYLHYVRDIWKEMEFFRLIEFKRERVIEEGCYEKEKNV